MSGSSAACAARHRAPSPCPCLAWSHPPARGIGLKGECGARIVNGRSSAIVNVAIGRFTLRPAIGMGGRRHGARGRYRRKRPDPAGAEGARQRHRRPGRSLPLLYGRKGLDGLEGLPADWLAANAREALEFIADKPKGRPQAARPPCGRRRQRRHARGRGGRDPQRRHAVPGRLGAGRAAGARARRAPAAAPDLQDPARQGRPAAGRSPAPATRAGATGTRRATSPSYQGAAGAARRAISPTRCRRSWQRCASSWPTGRPMLQRLEAAGRQLEMAPRQRAPRPAARVDGVPALAGAGQLHASSARASSSSRAMPRPGDLAPVEGSGLGVLRDPHVQVLRRGTELVAMTPEVRRFFFEPAPLIITKANVMSRVHRRGAHGLHRRQDLSPRRQRQRRDSLRRPLHVAGLRAPAGARSRCCATRSTTVLAASGYPPASHDGKALLNILDTFPRDELFQIGVEQLQEWSEGILDLEIAAARARVCARRPLRPVRVGARLCAARPLQHQGARAHRRAAVRRPTTAASPRSIPTSPKARWCACSSSSAATRARRRRSTSPSWSAGSPTIVRTWEDRLADAIAGTRRPRPRRCSPSTAAPSRPATRRPSRPERALEDIERIERLGAGPAGRRSTSIASPAHQPAASTPPSIRWARRSACPSACRCWRTWASRPSTSAPIRSARALPTASARWRCTTWCSRPTDGAADRARAATTSAWRLLPRRASRRGRQRRLQSAGRRGRRRLARGGGAAGLCRLSAPARLAVRPALPRRHARAAMPASRAICSSCSTCASIPTAGSAPTQREAAAGADPRSASRARSPACRASTRIASCARSSTSSTPRCAPTSTSATPTAGCRRRSPSSSTARRWRRRRSRGPSARSGSTRPRVEGIHLRFAPIARGGIRWSDRAQDFRTEVLGLVRAQLVKNAVIVPSGAKGGFLPKQLPRARQPRGDPEGRHRRLPHLHLGAARHHRQHQGRQGRAAARASCATTATIPIWWSPPTRAPPPSPTSPTRSRPQHGFWLGDAFASGGSAGYDHKGMAITARGAWECVKRHFREMDIDIQRQPFRVVGVGDMSGDVFGNGMLLSRAHPAGGGLRPPRHLHRSRSRTRGELRRAQAPVRSAALELAGLRQGQDLQGRRRVLARAPSRSR